MDLVTCTIPVNHNFKLIIITSQKCKYINNQEHKNIKLFIHVYTHKFYAIITYICMHVYTGCYNILCTYTQSTDFTYTASVLNG